MNVKAVAIALWTLAVLGAEEGRAPRRVTPATQPSSTARKTGVLDASLKLALDSRSHGATARDRHAFSGRIEDLLAHPGRYPA